jgi:hypothetical protein
VRLWVIISNRHSRRTHDRLHRLGQRHLWATASTMFSRLTPAWQLSFRRGIATVLRAVGGALGPRPSRVSREYLPGRLLSREAVALAAPNAGPSINRGTPPWMASVKRRNSGIARPPIPTFHLDCSHQSADQPISPVCATASVRGASLGPGRVRACLSRNAAVGGLCLGEAPTGAAR